MQKKQKLLAAAIAALAVVAAPAHADQVWNWSYSAGGVTASGQWDTVGNASSPEDLQWITGTYSDANITNGTITGLVPLGTDGYWIYDNKYGGNPVLSNPGVLFDVNNGQAHVNLFSENGGLVSGTRWNGNYVLTSMPTTSLTVASVPEPTSGVLLVAGLGALGLTARRRRRATEG
jgi:hypothetical protein